MFKKKKEEQCQTPEQPVQNCSGNILKERNSFLSIPLHVGNGVNEESGPTLANPTMELAGSLMVC